MIQNILVLYEQASGKKLNREKTSIFFSKAVSEETKANLSAFFGGARNLRICEVPWLTSGSGEEKESKLQLHQGEGLE